MNDFTINFDTESNIPIYKQLYDFLLREIRSGRLKENEKLPSRRALCSHLKINKNTVESAYQRLAAEGYIVAAPRSGFYVKTVGHVREEFFDDEKQIDDFKYNFSINSVDVSRLPHEAWAKLYKDIIYDNPNLFNHGENIGEYVLRKAISKYTHEFRGVNCRARQVIIGSGVDYLMSMLSAVLPSDTRYGFENPCLKRCYWAIKVFDRNIFTIDAKENGFDVDALKGSNIDVMYVMPSHQYPMGYKMNIDTRRKLIEWANEKENRYIIEDDYDCEFASDGKPITSIQGLDTNGKVIYLGNFSRSIGPSVKTSYAILPENLAEKWRDVLESYYAPVSLFEQWVLAEFIDDGHFMKHIKLMKNVYREKRDLLISELKKLEFTDKLNIFGEMGGTHFLVKVDTTVSQTELIKSARSAGVKIIPLSQHFFRTNNFIGDKILIFGFGGLDDFEICEATKLLGEAWKGI